MSKPVETTVAPAAQSSSQKSLIAALVERCAGMPPSTEWRATTWR